MNPIRERSRAISSRLPLNPLAIVAISLGLVEVVAGVTIIQGEFLTVPERVPLVYFVVAFPVAVLTTFVWLVSKHSEKLYGPEDLANLIRASVSLGAATTKGTSAANRPESIEPLVSSILFSTPWFTGGHETRREILWVDDKPDNNAFERELFESLGWSVTCARSTQEALEKHKLRRAGVIISDMGRPEDKQAGYALLSKLRKDGDQTPLIIYTASSTEKEKKDTLERQGNGHTALPRELFELVSRAARA